MSQLNAGLVLPYAPSASLLKWIQDAEAAGVPAVWSTVSGVNPDIVTVFAAAAATTRSIDLGTAVVPIYPRHPAALASQVVAIEGLAPGRLKLGVGPSHKPNMEGALGLQMGKPLQYLRERDLLWNGTTKASGEYLNVALDLPSFQRPTKTPILISALGEKAFRTAGEIADGAISWVSPIPYLVGTALPAVQAGADGAGRPAPPIVGHVPVAVTTDRDAARAAGKASSADTARTRTTPTCSGQPTIRSVQMARYPTALSMSCSSRAHPTRSAPGWNRFRGRGSGSSSFCTSS